MATINRIGPNGIYQDTEQGQEPIAPRGIQQEQAGGAPPAAGLMPQLQQTNVGNDLYDGTIQ